jgi:predicted transcriptional regulator
MEEQNYGDCAAKVISKESEIQREVSTLEKKLSRLREQLDSLSKRLKPVLHDELPGVESCDKAVEPLTELGKTINRNSSAVMSMSYFIEDLMERLEV